MQFKNFLKVGVVSLVAFASISNAAEPINTLIKNPQLDNAQIVQMIKQNISKDDLSYIVKNATADKSAKTEAIYNKINSLINDKYGSNHLDSVKKELNDTLKNMGANKVNVNYSYAVPKEIIEEIAKENPGLKTNHSSIANGAIDIAAKCDVTMNLAVDNKGRLFESSELAAMSAEQVSNMSKEQIMNTLKETLLHEASHCLLQSQMKDPNFSLKFSDSYAAKNPEIVKHLNEKMISVRDQVAAKKENVDVLDVTAFINFNENFADVNAAFAKLGDKPTAETIKEAKEQLLNVAKYRENTDLQHQTQYAIQNALDKIDLAATMNPAQRTVLAQEIASDSLLNNMELVFKSEIGKSTVGILSNYLVGGIKIDKDGNISEGVPQHKISEYEAIELEFDAMKAATPVMGSINQKLKTHKDLLEQYNNSNKPQLEQQKPISFNLGVMMKMRESSTNKSPALGAKNKYGG